jgi:hypothetical protein
LYLIYNYAAYNIIFDYHMFRPELATVRKYRIPKNIKDKCSLNILNLHEISRYNGGIIFRGSYSLKVRKNK